MICRSVRVNGERNSLRLEPAFWSALEELAQERGITVNKLAGEIAAGAGERSLAGEVRRYLIQHYRQAAVEAERCSEPASDDQARAGTAEA